mmetsp:Transcript_25826/g.54939  ORF Transcript_25826/g.54939 Transcript_25826/m.54939 type:complete len:228 (+) Transcript_25826:310-993(+)
MPRAQEAVRVVRRFRSRQRVGVRLRREGRIAAPSAARARETRIPGVGRPRERRTGGAATARLRAGEPAGEEEFHPDPRREGRQPARGKARVERRGEPAVAELRPDPRARGTGEEAAQRRPDRAARPQNHGALSQVSGHVRAQHPLRPPKQQAENVRHLPRGHRGGRRQRHRPKGVHPKGPKHRLRPLLPLPPAQGTPVPRPVGRRRGRAEEPEPPLQDLLRQAGLRY